MSTSGISGSIPGFLVILLICCRSTSNAQNVQKKDSSAHAVRGLSKFRRQRDLIDLAMMIMDRDPANRINNNMSSDSRIWHVSASPILEYTVATGLATGLAAGGAFLNGGR